MRNNTEWINISDLMTGLMMVFLFVAVVFMFEVKEKTQQEIHAALLEEFRDDLEKWDADLLLDNTFRFKSPDVLFVVGSDELKERFKNILDNFFPRYVGVLTQDRFIDDVSELRIEGHTSSEWEQIKNRRIRYLKNSELSQKRAHAVLDYCFDRTNRQIREHADWLIEVLRANGLAFAQTLNSDGRRTAEPGDEDENKERSRRVDFKVKTNLLAGGQ